MDAYIRCDNYRCPHNELALCTFEDGCIWDYDDYDYEEVDEYERW